MNLAALSHFQKLGLLLQEKIQFFVKRMVPPVFVMASPVSLFLQSLSWHPVRMLATMRSALMLDRLLRLLVFFLVARFVSNSRLSGGGPLDVLGQWQCGICGAIRCWPTRNQCYKCGQPRSASSCSPRSATYLDPQGMVGGLPQSFSGSSPLNPGMVHGPLGRPPPKRSQTPPTSRRGPTVSPKPPPGAGTGYVRFDKVLLFPLLPLCLRSLLIRFSPLGLLLVVLPLSLLVRLMIQWRISFVLWSSLVPSWTP